MTYHFTDCYTYTEYWPAWTDASVGCSQIGTDFTPQPFYEGSALYPHSVSYSYHDPRAANKSVLCDVSKESNTRY